MYSEPFALQEHMRAHTESQICTPEDFGGSRFIGPSPSSSQALAQSICGGTQPEGSAYLDPDDTMTASLVAVTPEASVNFHQRSRAPTPEDFGTAQTQEDTAAAQPPNRLRIDTKSYFYASGHFYYLDEYQRVYSEDGTIIHGISASFHADEHRSRVFHINGESFWFDRDDLMTQDTDGAQSRVHTWQSGTEIIGRHMSVHEMFHHLLHHGCLNLSSQMDTQQNSAMITNGGGFGDIWLGRLGNGTQVAIKAWRASIIEQCDYKILKRATREIYFWSRLKHENIQPLMGIIMFKGHYLGMVSEWMENGNLHGYMRKNPNFDRYQMSIQVASGLAYMHEHNAVHGDLRTANILVSLDGVARLTDFGLSTMSDAGLAFSETTTTQAGTVRWASPEQFLEESPIAKSKQSDVYALGMTILEIFTGNVPYYPECQKEFQVMKKVEKGIFPTRPTDYFKDDQHGNQMWGILTSCWSRNPDARPTAKEVIVSLNKQYRPSPVPSETNHFLWLPDSPAYLPIAATQNREPSAEASPDAQSGLLSGSIFTESRRDVAQVQQDAETTRPSSRDRRRCPICGKMFRRPSSLEDHLNVHSGDKPHVCPFKGCSTGYATKSGMKRHFLTHRAGPLEQYRPGKAPREATRAPITTYNSRTHHTLRFRVT